MARPDEVLQTYQDLAQCYDRQGQAKLRDWFLVLAADAALSAGLESEAERLRIRLLSYTPHHLLKPFGTFAEAMRSPDIQSYVGDLRRTYPPDTAQQMLANQRPFAPMRQESKPFIEPPSSHQAPDSNGVSIDESPEPRPQEKPSFYVPPEPAQPNQPFLPNTDLLSSPKRRLPKTPEDKQAPVPPKSVSGGVPIMKPPLNRERQSSVLNPDWRSPLAITPDSLTSAPIAPPSEGSREVSQWVCTILAVLLILAAAALTFHSIVAPILSAFSS